MSGGLRAAACRPKGVVMRRFWRGFAAGAAVGAGGAIGGLLLGRVVRRRSTREIIRLEKSLQIGRPLEAVFAAWSSLERLASLVPMVRRIHQDQETSHWLVNVHGRNVEFDAETTQFVPNEAIAWKSVTGPKHSGRIGFARLGDNTLIHVVMNYYPRPGILGEVLHPIAGLLDQALEQALRDFKASLEGKGQERAIEEQRELRA